MSENICSYISISDDALLSMVLNGMEAFVVGHIRNNKLNRRYTSETGGSIWGTKNKLKNNSVLYHINTISTDTSARTDTDSYDPTDEVYLLKNDIISSYWPEKEFFGDFHTHPFKNISYQEIEKEKNFEFSEQDRLSTQNDDLFNENNGLCYQIGLVLTMCTMQRVSSSDPKYINDSCIRFDMGNYRMWLKAYIYNRNKKIFTDEHLYLECHRLMGQNGQYLDFGKGVKKSSNSTIVHKTVI